MKTKQKLIICSILIGIIVCLLPILFSLKDEVEKKNPNPTSSNNASSVIKKEDILLNFIQDNTVEYGANVSSSDFIVSTNGEIIDQTALDTTKLGIQELRYRVQNKTDEREFKYAVEIIDTQKPIIETTYDHIIFDYNEKLDFSILNIKVYDKVDGSLPLSSSYTPHSYVLEHSIDTKVSGAYTLCIKAMDKNGLTNEKAILVEVKEEMKTNDNQTNDIQDDNNQEQSTINQNSGSQNPLNSNQPTYINGILIVNKQYAVPRDFGGENTIANNALYELQNAAYLAGFDMPLLSGYRSYDYQKSLYESYVARDGEEAANRYSAKPGTSEHQTGLAFDVGEMSWTYGETAAGQWLVNHCAEYGFILRYLPGKEDITGYMYEPWHIRYVGVEHATAIMSQGITLEEYLGV